MCTIKYIRFINNVLTLVMAKGDAPWDHHGSLLLQEHLCPCHSLWGVKPRCVIAIITHLCEWLIELCATSSVSPAVPTNPAPPAPATWGLQTDVADVFSLQNWQQQFFFSNGEGVPQSWCDQALNTSGVWSENEMWVGCQLEGASRVIWDPNNVLFLEAFCPTWLMQWWFWSELCFGGNWLNFPSPLF